MLKCFKVSNKGIRHQLFLVLGGETVVFRNKLSFAEATKTLLLMFFTSLCVLIQKVTKKSRLHPLA